MTAFTPTIQRYTSTSKHTPEPNGWLAHHDAAALRYMRTRLYEHVTQLTNDSADQRFSLVYLPEPDNRQHRVVLVNVAALLQSNELTFVAFFGHKRRDVDATMLDSLDHELIREFEAYPHLLSYSSLELSDGSWANLVLMSSPEGIARWAESQRHAYAARELAPDCYTSIRLHRGSLSAGIDPNGLVEFARTKHFAFA